MMGVIANSLLDPRDFIWISLKNTMNKLKIAVIHPWDRAKWSEPLMWDGLHGALKLINEKHQVDWFLQGDEPDDSYDWIIPWGVMSIPFNDTIEKFKGRKAIFCAGHPQDTANMDKFEAIFVESPGVQQEMSKFHKNVIVAFGTDTDFFQPTDTPKMFDAFYPATFSDNWKRQELFAAATKGYKAMACGLVQPDGTQGLQACLTSGTYTMDGLIPTRLIADLYNMSKVVVITSWHGSERSTLEAMSCNVPLVLVSDNELACSLVNEEVIIVKPTVEAIRSGFERALRQEVSTRDYILENYSHRNYAERILKVIES